MDMLILNFMQVLGTMCSEILVYGLNMLLSTRGEKCEGISFAELVVFCILQAMKLLLSRKGHWWQKGFFLGL